MSEAKSPCVWLEMADHELAQFIGDVADNKRQLTQEAREEKIRQTVQGAHLVLRDCEASVAKLRNDYTAKALVAADVDSKTTRTLRRAYKLVAKKADGAIVLEGNAPSSLGHELTTENTQMREERNRRHTDDIAVYQGLTTDDALDSQIFNFSGLVPPSVAAAVTAGVPVPAAFPTAVPTPAVPNVPAPTPGPTPYPCPQHRHHQ
jgi:hypothetical protein